MNTGEVINARDLERYYRVRKGGLFQKPITLKAMDGVSFSIHREETLGVVGESGCGKSTLARLVTMIERPTAGQFEINGMDLPQALSSHNVHLCPTAPRPSASFGSIGGLPPCGIGCRERLLTPADKYYVPAFSGRLGIPDSRSRIQGHEAFKQGRHVAGDLLLFFDGCIFFNALFNTQIHGAGLAGGC